MEAFISYINVNPAMLGIAAVLIWGTLVSVLLQWHDKKQSKWNRSTSEGKEQRLRARRIIIHEYYA